jgi:hypothetical protein
MQGELSKHHKKKIEEEVLELMEDLEGAKEEEEGERR